jgi:hypothetical protein
MSISRRDALRGVGAASAAIVMPAIAIAVFATKDQDSDARLKATVARWHQAYEDFKEAHPYDAAHPRVYNEDGDTSVVMSAVHEELSGMHPKTLAGVVALLCCAETLQVDWNRNWRGATDGARVPIAVFHFHGDRMQQNATAALGRLAGEA